MKKIGINIIFEPCKTRKKIVYVASSPDINVVAEGKTIEEARKKFINGTKLHLRQFPEEKAFLLKEEATFEMPLLTRVFL